MSIVELSVKIEKKQDRHSLIMELIGGYEGEMPKEVDDYLREKAGLINRERIKLEAKLKNKL